MQTTLLGLAVALILALATALAAPLYIDWTRYRAEFEARASSLTGLDIHITGAIDARLLPTPTLVMHGIEVGGSGAPGKERQRARALRLEFELGALVRGQWRLREVLVEDPDLHAGIDAAGHLDWSKSTFGLRPEGVSIDALHLTNGRVTFTDAASGSRLVVEKLEFRGELRSLGGSVKGQGSFAADGAHFAYQIAASPIEGSAGMKVRLVMDAPDRPLGAQVDLSVLLDQERPRFEGNLHLARPVGRAAPGSHAPIIEPWRLTASLKGDSAAAALDQIEFQYGPDEHATKLRGAADLTFGRSPRAKVVLTSSQIDLDRMLSGEAHPRPLAVARQLAEALPGKLPMPASVTIAVDSVVLGGAALQRLNAELEGNGNRLDIKSLEFRAPGVTQVRLSRDPQATSSGDELAARVVVETSDRRAFVAWLANGVSAAEAAPGEMRLVGNVSLSAHAVSLDRLEVELDRMNVSGHFAYAWGADGRPARLDAALSAPAIDLDRMYVIGTGVFGDSAIAWPHAGQLSLKAARASMLGVEARDADVNVRLDANGVDIDPLKVADFGGAALAIRGRIDTRAASPRGTVTLDLDARVLHGLVAVLQRFAPAVAEQLRRSAPQVSPLLLRASITMDPGAASEASARLKVDGRAGPFRLAVLGDAFSPGEALKSDKLAALNAAKLNLIGRVESDDGAALIDLAGLDRYVSIDKGPALLALTAKGGFGGEIEIDGGLTAGSLAASTNGRIRILPKAMPVAALDLRLSNLNLRVPRAPGGGSSAELLPLSLTTRLALTEGALRLAAIKGTVAGTPMTGQLVVGLERPTRVEGSVDLSALDLTHSVAVLIGAPPAPQPRAAETRVTWPAEPFDPLFGPLRGEVGIKSTRVRLTPGLEARDFNGVVRFGETQAALEVKEASLAGGRLLGELVFLRERGGLLARTRFNLLGGNAAELLPGDGAVAGRLDAQLNAQGAGMSAVALIGSLEGSINFTLEEGRLARLDPRAFDAAIQAVDQGLPVETSRLRERMELALASGVLAVPRTEGAVTISAGQLRGNGAMSGEHGGELSVNGRVDLTDGDMDARLLLARAITSTGSVNAPPGIVVTLKGPIGAPLRSIDVAAFAGWLALRAVDQQTKKIDLLEGREASVPDKPDPVAPAEEGHRPVAPRAAPPAAPRVAPAAAPRAAPPLPRPRPAARPPRPRREPIAPSPYQFWWGFQ